MGPMLPSTGLYSNFWGGMTNTYYYLRTEEYRQILDRKVVGVHPVPMVHSALLIHLRIQESDLLAYSPDLVRSLLILELVLLPSSITNFAYPQGIEMK